MSNLIKSWNNRTIRIRGDRYVSLTDMAQATGVKKLLSWDKTKAGKSFLSAASRKLDLPTTALMELKTQEKWVHPIIFYNIVVNALPVAISFEMESWWFELHGQTLDSVTNQVASLLPELVYLVPSTNRELIWEKDYSDYLAEELDGEREVPVPSGRIDVLTETEIIEVKEKADWLEAVEQVNRYSTYFPYKTKRIHLFGKSAKYSDSYISQYCEALNIRATFHK